MEGIEVARPGRRLVDVLGQRAAGRAPAAERQPFRPARAQASARAVRGSRAGRCRRRRRSADRPRGWPLCSSAGSMSTWTTRPVRHELLPVEPGLLEPEPACRARRRGRPGQQEVGRALAPGVGSPPVTRVVGRHAVDRRSTSSSSGCPRPRGRAGRRPRRTRETPPPSRSTGRSRRRSSASTLRQPRRPWRRAEGSATVGGSCPPASAARRARPGRRGRPRGRRGPRRGRLPAMTASANIS